MSRPVPETVAFELNGRPETVPDDGGSLLDALRQRLGVRSVKDGCSPQGQCGCCTVLVDGAPRVACVTPAARVAGRAVTTVEGLADADRWAEAFTATGASQCGFCTPGIIVRLAATRQPVDQALLAHLCRCTGWQTIEEAAALVSVSRSSENLTGRQTSVKREGAEKRAAIEGRTPQRAGPKIALGGGGFADDTAPADALVAVAAKVKDIDVRAEMWALLRDVEAGRRASEVLFGPLAARMPATLVKRVDTLAATAAKAVARLVEALVGSIASVASKHAELERVRSECWFALLPARVQEAIGHAVLGKRHTIQVERLEELMRAVIGLNQQYRSVHVEFLKATVSRADAGLDWDWAKKQPADAAALSPVQLLHKFRIGILVHFVQQGVSAPGVTEFAENLQRRRVAAARREVARRQAEEQILKIRRTAA